MIKDFAKLLAITLCLTFSGLLWAVNQPKQEVSIGTAAIYAPFESVRNGQIIGFDVDLIRALAKELDWKITLVNMPFEDLIPALKRNKIDLAISAINITPERLNELDFSNLYHQPNALVWVYDRTKGTYPQASNKIKLRVGVQKGTVMEDWLKQKNISSVKIIKIDSTSLLFNNLQNNLLDTIVVEKKQAVDFCKNHPALTFQTTGDSVGGYAIAFKKGSAQVTKVNLALAKLKADGFLDANTQKWLN